MSLSERSNHIEQMLKESSSRFMYDPESQVRAGDMVFGTHRVGWYNHRRLHTAIGDIPPIEHETTYYRSINTPAPTGAR